MAQHPLVGTWRLLRWQVVVDGEPPRDLAGPDPRGFLILTAEGRAMALTTGSGRAAGDDDAAREALHRSMLAYSGRYRVDGEAFVTTVDACWNEAWNGTEQRRFWRIEEGRLFIRSAPGPSIVFPGKTDHRLIVWEREA